MKKLLKIILQVSLIIFIAGFFIPENPTIPVKNAKTHDWNNQSFWYYPWGRSGVHKGIDIFAPEGRNVIAATGGIVIYTGKDGIGGNVVLVLGAQWRWHYYAHLKTINTTRLKWVSAGEKIATVGSTGNAKGKPAHLHYSIKSTFPRFWRWDKNQRQPWQRLFYINPDQYLRGK
ncbi:MAG: M23 family metallopeptidase [Thiotrichaceae bacterium]|nr:M23 family metallopeptidase [Thiotrichaceae bacterium]